MVLPDTKIVGVVEKISDEENSKILATLLSTLSEREMYVLERRFGLNEKKPMMLEAVGKALGITRERVRQIEAIGLRKLNLPKNPNITFPQYADMVRRSIKLNVR